MLCLRGANVRVLPDPDSLDKSTLLAGYGESFDAMKYLKPGLTLTDVIQIKEVFDEFDVSKKGFLKPADIRTALFKHGYTAR